MEGMATWHLIHLIIIVIITLNADCTLVIFLLLGRGQQVFEFATRQGADRLGRGGWWTSSPIVSVDDLLDDSIEAALTLE